MIENMFICINFYFEKRKSMPCYFALTININVKQKKTRFLLIYSLFKKLLRLWQKKISSTQYYQWFSFC